MSVRQRLSWTLVVAVSAVIVLGVVLGIAVWWAVTSEARVTSYAVRGQRGRRQKRDQRYLQRRVRDFH